MLAYILNIIKKANNTTDVVSYPSSPFHSRVSSIFDIVHFYILVQVVLFQVWGFIILSALLIAIPAVMVFLMKIVHNYFLSFGNSTEIHNQYGVSKGIMQ